MNFVALLVIIVIICVIGAVAAFVVEFFEKRGRSTPVSSSASRSAVSSAQIGAGSRVTSSPASSPVTYMSHWFSDYSRSDWKPGKGYNKTFLDTVALLRDWFGLLPHVSQPGVERGNLWREYELGRISDVSKEISGTLRKVCVNVSELRWNEYFLKDAKIWLRFRLKVKIRWDEGGNTNVFFNDELIVEFPSGSGETSAYPINPPMFFLKSFQDMGASHEHHLWSKGELCLFKDNKQNEWKAGDTIISAMNAALNWIVWHHSKFGS